MKINLKVLKKELKEIADKHQQIDSFFWGDFVRFYEEKSVKHRTLIATFLRVPTASRTRTTINLILTIADRSYRDNRDLDDIQSDSVEILNDIITIINRSKRWREFLTQEIAPSIDVFQERGGDMVAGAFASINFNINNLSDICAIPIVGYDFNQNFAPSCEPAIFLINGVQVRTIPSGSQGEVKVLDLLNNEVGSFNGTNWIVASASCVDASYRLLNTDDTVLLTGNIPSGEEQNIIAPDSTFSINDVNVRTAASGGSANIQVRRQSGSNQIGSLQGQHWRIGNSTYNVIDQDAVNYASGSLAAETTGNNILINVPKPQGITFQIPIPSSIISNTPNQDAGFRYSNSFFNYNNPQNTKIQPELDFTHANPHFNLKEEVSFRGVSSKKRFVDIRGAQDFTTYPDVFVDKYTGLTYRRVILSADEATSFTNTQSLSITTDGITLSDWYLASLDELLSIYGYGKLTNNTEIVDPDTSAQINVSSGIGSGVRTSSSATSGNYLAISNLQSLTVLSVASSLTRVYLVVTKELLTEFDDYI